jgi:putative flippase GtrA
MTADGPTLARSYGVPVDFTRMPQEATTVEFPISTQTPTPPPARELPVAHRRLKLHVRVRHGVRRPHNWLQLVRFGAVGASGYVVNLVVFAVCVHILQMDYRIAAVIAWIVSVLNNFWFNRHWTFGAKEAHPVRQGVRFFTVSLLAFGFTYAVLIVLVKDVGLTKVLAQAIAIAAGMPLNFVGQKLWSFKA